MHLQAQSANRSMARSKWRYWLYTHAQSGVTNCPRILRVTLLIILSPLCDATRCTRTLRVTLLIIFSPLEWGYSLYSHIQWRYWLYPHAQSDATRCARTLRMTLQIAIASSEWRHWLYSHVGSYSQRHGSTATTYICNFLVRKNSRNLLNITC